MKRGVLLIALIATFGLIGCNQAKQEEKQAVQTEEKQNMKEEPKEEEKEITEPVKKEVSKNETQTKKEDVIPGMKIEDIQPFLSELGVQQPTVEQTETGYQVLAMDEYNVFGYLAFLDKDKDVRLISYTIRKPSAYSEDEFLDLAKDFLSVCASQLSYDGAEPFRAENGVERMVEDFMLNGTSDDAEYGGINFSIGGEKDNLILIVSKITEPEDKR